MKPDNFLLRTAEAARLATELGRRTSPSLLRKLRAKGTADPGTKGPPWKRAPNGDCLYSRPDIQHWVGAFLAECRPLEPAQQPERLRSNSSRAA